MRAIVKVREEPGMEMRQVRVPDPGPEEVLVRVKAAAVCGTDLHIAQWNAWARNAGIRLPLVMGHEFCGEVVEVGRGARTLRPGEYVAGETHLPCGECYQCRNGQQHICGNLKLFGIHRDGCFAEYATIPERCAYPVPASISPRVAAMLEPLGTSLRAVLEMDVAGSSVAVLGCGPIGLFAIAAAKVMGASWIVGVDVQEQRLALAKRMGCDFALDPRRDTVADVILHATAGVGIDAFIDASGSEAAIEGAFRFLRKGGRCALIGLPASPVRLNLGPDVIFKEAKVVGIHGREMFRTWTQMQQLLESGRLDVGPVATHELPLSDHAEGFSLLETGKAAKVILVP